MLGKYITFDKITAEYQIMNLAKFLMFCKDFELVHNPKLNPVGIPIKTLKMFFKKCAPTVRTVQFKEFKQLIDKIGIRYYSRVKKKHVRRHIGNYKSI